MNKKSRGQILVLAALFLPIVAILGALAIDGLFLYRDHAQLDSWTYEAAVAGATEVMSVGDQLIINEADALARVNEVLTVRNITPSRGCVVDSVSIDQELFVDVRTHCTRPTYLIGGLSSLFDPDSDIGRVTITAHSRVQATILY
jgi:hypothetical protein